MPGKIRIETHQPPKIELTKRRSSKIIMPEASATTNNKITAKSLLALNFVRKQKYNNTRLVPAGRCKSASCYGIK